MKPPARLTVVEQVCHQDGEGEPVVAACQWGRSLITEEQPWVRKFLVGPEWKPLETGWLTRVGMLHLANNEGKDIQRIPTREEKALLASRVIELGVSSETGVYPFLIIRPGESARLEPADLSTLLVRCQYQSARCTLTAVPE